jgi:hypothetical protein
LTAIGGKDKTKPLVHFKNVHMPTLIIAQLIKEFSNLIFWPIQDEIYNETEKWYTNVIADHLAKSNSSEVSEFIKLPRYYVIEGLFPFSKIYT